MATYLAPTIPIDVLLYFFLSTSSIVTSIIGEGESSVYDELSKTWCGNLNYISQYTYIIILFTLLVFYSSTFKKIPFLVNIVIAFLLAFVFICNYLYS